MSRAASLLALRFLATTIPLTWLWIEWGRKAYGQLFVSVTSGAFAALGAPGLPIATQERFGNLLPFAVLMLITPDLSPRRRLLGTLAGAFALALGHGAVELTRVAVESGSGGALAAAHAPMLVLSDSLPFMLWVVAAHEVVRSLLTRVFPRPRPA